MTIFQAVASGILQGLTEFFPISSSGHLVLLHTIFGLKEPQLAFDIFLHFGTLIAVVIFFWRDLVDLALLRDKRRLLLLVTASIPTAIMAFVFKDMIEGLFASSRMVGYALVLTGTWLLAGNAISNSFLKRGMKRTTTFLGAIVIGIAQGVALVPGISRSGATISTAFLLGIDREEALKFSFILSLPAVLGANLLEIHEVYNGATGGESFYFLAGCVAAVAAGLLAIKTLFKFVKTKLFTLFGIYCILMGFLVIISF
jgi:undecaprenyl-diphosphatase